MALIERQWHLAAARDGLPAQSDPVVKACLGIIDAAAPWPLMAALFGKAQILHGNFHPEWGYVVPTARFRHTLRVALVAAAIGAMAGSVVVTSLVAPTRSKMYNTLMYARAPASSKLVLAAPADALANTTVGPADTASPALAALSPDSANPPDSAPAADQYAAPPIGDGVPARKNPAKAHRSRLAHILKYRRSERRFARSFQLPHNSGLVQFDQFCCAWTRPPIRRNDLGW